MATGPLDISNDRALVQGHASGSPQGLHPHDETTGLCEDKEWPLERQERMRQLAAVFIQMFKRAACERANVGRGDA